MKNRQFQHSGPCDGRALRRLGALAVLLAGVAVVAPAAAQTPAVEIPPAADRAGTFEARGEPLRALLDRLFAGDGEVEIVWRSRKVGEDKVSGSFTGTADEIAKRLLQGASYIMAYDGEAGRIRRIIILGYATANAGAEASSDKISYGPGAPPAEHAEAREAVPVKRREPPQVGDIVNGRQILSPIHQPKKKR